jgi:hypothetical protein
MESDRALPSKHTDVLVTHGFCFLLGGRLQSKLKVVKEAFEVGLQIHAVTLVFKAYQNCLKFIDRIVPEIQ